MKCTACGQTLPKISPEEALACQYCLVIFRSDTGRKRKYCSPECRWKGAAVEWYLERLEETKNAVEVGNG